MSTIEQRPTITLEVRALDALVGYGDDAFVKVFYEHLGKHYMQPHEAGLKSVRELVPGILRRTDDARLVFTGQRIAVEPQKKDGA